VNKKQKNLLKHRTIQIFLIQFDQRPQKNLLFFPFYGLLCSHVMVLFVQHLPMQTILKIQKPFNRKDTL